MADLDLDTQIIHMLQDLPYSPIEGVHDAACDSTSIEVSSSQTTDEPSILAPTMDTSREKEIAWCKAVVDRPLPKLSLPSNRLSRKSPTSPHAIILGSATSPTLSTSSSRRSSGGASGSPAYRVRKVYRLEMRNKVVAGLWKALQDLSSG